MEKEVKKTKKEYHLPDIFVTSKVKDDILLTSGWGEDKIFDDDFTPTDDGFGG